jgi:mannose-6-phosphate isomerase-like protein (cupin superfamily)
MTESVIDVPRHRGQFFEILQETARCQTAVMTIAPGQDGGPTETHAGDQVVYVIEGEGILTIEGVEHRVRPGACALIPAGTGAESLFFFSVYAPPAY